MAKVAAYQVIAVNILSVQTDDGCDLPGGGIDPEEVGKVFERVADDAVVAVVAVPGRDA